MQIPAWPFVSLSFGVGIFALGPFFALWTPSREARSPPGAEELQGWRNFGLKGTESKLGSWLIFASALFLVGQVGSLLLLHLGFLPVFWLKTSAELLVAQPLQECCFAPATCLTCTSFDFVTRAAVQRHCCAALRRQHLQGARPGRSTSSCLARAALCT